MPSIHEAQGSSPELQKQNNKIRKNSMNKLKVLTPAGRQTQNYYHPSSSHVAATDDHGQTGFRTHIARHQNVLQASCIRLNLVISFTLQ
jgi:hypothetical protein